MLRRQAGMHACRQAGRCLEKRDCIVICIVISKSMGLYTVSRGALKFGIG